MTAFEIPRFKNGTINREEFYKKINSSDIELPTVLKQLSEIDALELLVQSDVNKNDPELFKNYSKTEVPSEGSYDSFKQQLDSIKKKSIT